MGKRVIFLSAFLVALAAACYAVIPRKAPYPIWSVAFSPDGKFLAAGSGTVGVADYSLLTGRDWRGEGAVHVWQSADWKQCGVFREGFTTRAHSVTFSPDSATLAAGGDRYNLKSQSSPAVGSWVRFWAAAGWQEQSPVELNYQKDEPGGSIVRIAYSPRGDRLIIGRSGGPSVMLDPKKKVITYLMNSGTSSAFLAIAPDGTKMVGCNRPGSAIRLYQAEDGAPLASQTRGIAPPMNATDPVDGKPQPPAGIAVCVQFSPDGSLIAAGCDDGTVYLFDSSLEKEIGRLKVAGEAHALAFSSDGQLLAVACDGNVRLFEVGSWKPVRTLGKNAGGINSIAFSPDGKVLAAGCGTIEGNDRVTANGVVRIWDVATSNLIKDLE